MQGSLSSKLGLFTVCSLLRWLGTTEQHLNSKIMLYTHTSSFLYPFQPRTFIENFVLALQSSYSIHASRLKRGSLYRLDTENVLHRRELQEMPRAKRVEVKGAMGFKDGK